MIKQDHGTPFSITMAGTASATATQVGVSAQTIYLTDVSGSSDLTGATITIKDGSTAIWQDVVKEGYYRMNFLSPIRCTVGNSLLIAVTGTTLSTANASGFILNNS